MVARKKYIYTNYLSKTWEIIIVLDKEYDA